MLGSGIPLLKAFDLAAGKTQNSAAKKLMNSLAESARKGNSISEGLKAEEERVPPLMIEMVTVAEESGMLPEILSSLARHFENALALRKRFVTALIPSALRYVAAVLIIALLIWILGLVAERNPGQKGGFDPLGFGLTGESGAISWLLLNFGTVAAFVFGLKFIRSSIQGQKALDPWLMKIPVVGACMRDFAIARFSWAFALTQQTGMSILRSLELALRATDNGKYIAQTSMICGLVSEGEELSTALHFADGFPEEYISQVSIAESSGTVPEALERLSPQFEENAQRSLNGLVSATGVALFILTALFVIYLIFRIAMWYAGMLNDAIDGAL